MVSAIHSMRRRTSQGFSLIELLITIVIFLLLLSVGIANFIRFNDRQKVTESVRKIKSSLQLAHTRTRTGDLGGCDLLAGYSVTSSVQPDQLTHVVVSAECDDGSSAISEEITLFPSVTVSPAIDVFYEVISGYVCLTSDCTNADETYTVDNSGMTYSFVVTNAGEVRVGDWD